jgi:hypothetical protein
MVSRVVHFGVCHSTISIYSVTTDHLFPKIQLDSSPHRLFLDSTSSVIVSALIGNFRVMILKKLTRTSKI